MATELTDEQIEEMKSASYATGRLAAWTEILLTARQNVGWLTGSTEMDRDQLLALRAETVLALRAICEEFGDNDWHDDLHPRDVIEKHLAKHVRAVIEQGDEA
jgi:hypothetical protein